MTAKERRLKKDDRFEILVGFEAHVLAQYCAPFTGGSRKHLAPGLRFVVISDPPDTATAIGARAEPYEYWETMLVDKVELSDDKYDGYYLVIPFEDLWTKCSRL